ncbi:monooxygenase [Roseovarius sp. A46]|uniref:FAD-dependent oxidoreductase n=1 Tax=Roseovarius sp. A46 TaxID=2109331 RepID=UPI001013690E|nr:FAD-dependent oxidoreductase [Roseovarius sp. A46]RXV61645.1 monooxygenase [Roseovarius sp. A46]
MGLDTMKIAVIGAGIGGLAVAQALARRGADVTVFEQASEIAEVGAGLQISPNGARVLDALGLGAELRQRAVMARTVQLCDYRGGEVVRLDLGDTGQGGYHFLHRADLINLLANGARAAGVRIRLLQRIIGVTDGRRPRVELANGAGFDADLVIGADGLHSVVRAALNGPRAPFFTGQVAWRALVPNSAERGPEVRVHMGPIRHVVSYPLRGGSMLNLVAVQERAAWTAESWSQTDDPQSLRAAFGDFCDEVQGMLAAVDKVNLWGLFRHEVARAWHGEGLAILGDAAHPTLPFMAQGACLALEDGWVLAAALDEEGDVAKGLVRYQALRESRARRVVAAASTNAWKYHLAFPPLRWAAHTALRAGGRLAPSRMIRQFDWIYGYNAIDAVGQPVNDG